MVGDSYRYRYRFAIGVITMLGNKVSTAMKAFLAALAIIDDLIAIVVIALFLWGRR